MDWVGEQTHPGKPTELRLTPDSIRRAVAGGMPVDHILQTLASVNTGPLPDALVGAIKAWGRYYGKVTIEETILLRVQDEAVLSELRNDPEMRPLLKAFAPHGAVAVVKKGELERLRRALRERGIHVTFED